MSSHGGSTVELLKMLRASERLLIVAILERFVPSESLMRMRVALDPAAVEVGVRVAAICASVGDWLYSHFPLSTPNTPPPI